MASESRTPALIYAIECGFMPNYDQLDRWQEVYEVAFPMAKLEVSDLCIYAYERGMVPDYDRQAHLGIDHPAVLKAMYEAGLKPEARHRGDKECWHSEINVIMATCWRRFALVRACWRKWEQCLYRPDGRAVQGAANHFKALAGGEGSAAKKRRQM